MCSQRIPCLTYGTQRTFYKVWSSEIRQIVSVLAIAIALIVVWYAFNVWETGRLHPGMERPLGVREDELRRRPVPPSTSPPKDQGLPLDYEQNISRREPWTPEALELAINVESMPSTACQSVEFVPETYTNAYYVHGDILNNFVNSSGFGFRRIVFFPNKRGRSFGSQTVDRVELVSLLLHDEPCVYVLDDVPTPDLTRQAQHRTLDEFEQHGLAALRLGAELVWTREAPNRMFGAIRAETDCIQCHPGARA